MLLHLGVGYQDATIGQLAFAANTPYNATTALGLKGPFSFGEGSTFPHFGSMSNAQGGLADLGNASFNGTTLTKNQRPTAIANLTWVKNNHTYKFGGELRVDGFPAYNLINLNGYYAFNAAETALPYLNSATLAGNTLGFPFASFLLGQVDNGNVSAPANAKLGQHSLGFFAQDTWKVTRKLTLDYGLRWDYSTYQKEQYGRYPTLDPLAPNASAGGHPGAVTYEATCGCTYAKNYPYAWGPRLGAAYQIDPKTVVRGGIGLMYNTSARIGIAGRSLGSTNPFTSPSFGESAMVLGTGVPLTYQQIAWPNFDPNYYPVFGRSPGAGPANVFDQNAARPARQLQWSIGLQREIFRDLVIEASYVGNIGVWWTANAAVNYNTIQPSTLQSLGIDINNPADVTLLNSQVGSAAVKARGFGLPFSTFPSNATLAQALRPYPQFNSGLGPQFAPLGTTSYNSLQAKVTKRLSHGIDFTYAFTYQKSLTFGTSINDVWNRDANKQVLDSADQPLQSVIAFTYNVPRMNGINKILAYALYDWQIGGLLKYASGFPIPVPGAQNNLGNCFVPEHVRQPGARRAAVPEGPEQRSGSAGGFRAESRGVDRSGCRPVGRIGSLLRRLPLPAEAERSDELRPQLPGWGAGDVPGSRGIHQYLQPGPSRQSEPGPLRRSNAKATQVRCAAGASPNTGFGCDQLHGRWDNNRGKDNWSYG